MKKVICRFLILVFLGLSVVFGYLAYKEYQPILKSDIQKETIKKMVVSEEDTDDPDSPYNRVIDFEALKRINKDVVGWLYIPDTSIDYPILIGDTDTEYLHKDIEGKYNYLGCIFSFADTSKDLSDARTLLFGHNMRQYAMFGELRRYLEKDFRKKHTKIYVYTEKKTMELETFSIFVCNKNDGIFWDDTTLGSAEYQDLLKTLDKRNQYSNIEKKNIEEYYNNQMFSLISCRGAAGTSNRLMVNAIEVREKYLLNY